MQKILFGYTTFYCLFIFVLITVIYKSLEYPTSSWMNIHIGYPLLPLHNYHLLELSQDLVIMKNHHWCILILQTYILQAQLLPIHLLLCLQVKSITNFYKVSLNTDTLTQLRIVYKCFLLQFPVTKPELSSYDREHITYKVRSIHTLALYIRSWPIRSSPQLISFSTLASFHLHFLLSLIVVHA